MKVAIASLRMKLMFVLLLATIVPMTIGLVSVHVLGRRYYRSSQGQLFETASQNLALSLRKDIDHQVDLLRNWIASRNLAAQIDQGAPPTSPGELESAMAKMERKWMSWSGNDPAMRPWLDNPIAEAARNFKKLNPCFAEILITDRQGRLAAASGKTSDFFQADEQWWRQARDRGGEAAWLEGVNFDESAGVYSVDIAMSVHDGEYFAGVVKGVLDISPMFAELESRLPTSTHMREVVLDDGRILISFRDKSSKLPARRLKPALMDAIRFAQQGWTVSRAEAKGECLVGFSRIHFASDNAGDNEFSGLYPMYVIVRATLGDVMAPVSRQLLSMSLAGILLIAVFLFIGLYLSDRKIVKPVRFLRRAAQDISARAHLSGAEDLAGRRVRSQPNLEDAVRWMQGATRQGAGDEIGDLTHDFLLMAKRVLRYHEQLETELKIKTEEINSDLMIAREFQESLLPKEYPEVPGPVNADPIGLDFYHVYKPATSVSGDLVHMIKLSEHKAGVFIADVMGHGTRSALISAILRTLVQNTASQTEDPAAVMNSINTRFLEILPRRTGLIFATAFYAVFDTREAVLRYAGAGHPSPLLAKKKANVVESVLNTDHNDPALGLVAEAEYRGYERNLETGDLYLFYTDGVLEAPNIDGEEFGEERLRETMLEMKDEKGPAVSSQVMSALNSFMDVVVSPDDICIVTVDIIARTKS